MKDTKYNLHAILNLELRLLAIWCGFRFMGLRLEMKA